MSTQYSTGGETSGSAIAAAADADTTNNRGSASSNTGSSGGDVRNASNKNWGSARSDYGEQAYGGSLDERGLGGLGYDDFSEGRRDEGSRGESTTRARRRAGYSLGDTGSTGLTLLAGMVIGATLMYMFDPEQGGRRRALLRDKLIAFSNDASDTLGKTSRDLRDRAQGVIAETTKALGLNRQEGTGGDNNGAQTESSTTA